MVLVKFYFDVITKSFLQLINTWIDIFFCAFLADKEERRPVMVKRKLDGAVHESSANQKICKSDVTPVKNLKVCTQWSLVLRQAGRLAG